MPILKRLANVVISTELIIIITLNFLVVENGKHAMRTYAEKPPRLEDTQKSEIESLHSHIDFDECGKKKKKKRNKQVKQEKKLFYF